MKQKQLVPVAIACGVVCAVCVALFMASVKGEAETARAEALARYGGEQVEVCVVTRDVVAGERLDLSAVETKLWVADLLPEGAVRAISDAVGKTATSPIFKGEVIVGGRFESEHDSLEVPRGKQAVSVPAKAVQAVGGAVRPGMSVDVYSSGDTSTVALARNVNVLDASVGSSGSLTSGDGGWVTLAVEPEKIQEIIAASNRTTLYFALPGETIESGDASQEGSSDNDAASEGKDGKGASATQASSKSESSGKNGDSETSSSGEGAYATNDEQTQSSRASDAKGETKNKDASSSSASGQAPSSSSAASGSSGGGR